MDHAKFESLLMPTDTSIKLAMQKLNETAERILFIVDNKGRLLGTVTDGDIRRGIIDGGKFSDKVEKVMHRNFTAVTLNKSYTEENVKKLMIETKLEQIPVLDDAGIIVDVILWTDVLEDKKYLAPQKFFNNAVVIMAGGKGTRLDPFTKILPKPLIPIHNKPIIEHITDRFYKNGFRKFILILNYKKEMIKLYFAENKLPYEISFIEEDDFYGTAGGLSLLRDALNDTFIVTNCDTVLEGEYEDFFNWHRERNNLMTIIGSHKEITVPYGVLNMEEGSLVGIDEKPKIDLFVNTGTYIFEPGILNLISKKERIDMDKLIAKVREKYKDKVNVYPHWGGWFDIGQWDEYRRSLKHLGEQTDDI